jgi:hypothetical protein
LRGHDLKALEVAAFEYGNAAAAPRVRKRWDGEAPDRRRATGRRVATVALGRYAALVLLPWPALWHWLCWTCSP